MFFDVEHSSGVAGYVFLLFVFLAIGLVWMGFALIYYIVGETSKQERVALIHKFAGPYFESILQQQFGDASAILSKKQYLEFLENESLQQMLKMLGVKPLDMLDVCDHVFGVGDDMDKPVLQLRELIDLVTKLMGDNYATVKDVMKYSSQGGVPGQADIVERLDRLEGMLEKLLASQK
eukprot:TRINITY_DN46512_c0_g1_i1.p2 TRINITY_DN46512_c0_g1~~TRINITY_DN46512_c0_g1_i1.p2  ORF type:complete len:178 (-),score=46.60 TRINITY_DN46512_c0_g1_i1:330-863(-)